MHVNGAKEGRADTIKSIKFDDDDDGATLRGEGRRTRVMRANSLFSG